eukprot:12900663-Prorocentrum_lima.AAC.1
MPLRVLRHAGPQAFPVQQLLGVDGVDGRSHWSTSIDRESAATRAHHDEVKEQLVSAVDLRANVVAGVHRGESTL